MSEKMDEDTKALLDSLEKMREKSNKVDGALKRANISVIDLIEALPMLLADSVKEGTNLDTVKKKIGDVCDSTLALTVRLYEMRVKNKVEAK